MKKLKKVYNLFNKIYKILTLIIFYNLDKFKKKLIRIRIMNSFNKK